MTRLWFLFLCSGTLGLLGCLGDSSSSQQSGAGSESSVEFIDIHKHYRDQRYSVALKALDELMLGQPHRAEAILLKGFILLRTGDSPGAHFEFSKVPESERALMAESCPELREIESSGKAPEVMRAAKEFFPDCVPELGQSVASSDDTEFPKEKVLFLGKLYDQAIRHEGDLEVRRKKEEAFLKKHGLSETQLGEITSRYLDCLAEEN